MTVNSPLSSTDKMSKPQRQEMIGQYNDEYNDEAHEKMRSKHYIPRKRPIAWRTTPILSNLPGSCDDEFFDEYHVFTSVDLGMIRNASANALVALSSKTFDEVAVVTEENCIRVSLMPTIEIVSKLFHLKKKSKFRFSLLCLYFDSNQYITIVSIHSH